MIDNFEFSDAKQVRKTLLITSFAGICFKALVKNSTGNIEFFGFKIPVEDASIIPTLVGGLIIFEIIALVIRYSDETARENYKKHLDMLIVPSEKERRSNIFQYNQNNIIKKSVLFLDIIFPLLFGITSLIKIFFL